MTINAQRLRIKCGKRIYEKTMKAGMLNTPWGDLAPEIKDGFIKMAAEVFDVLFTENPKDIIEFFTGIEVKLEKNDAKNKHH